MYIKKLDQGEILSTGYYRLVKAHRILMIRWSVNLATTSRDYSAGKNHREPLKGSVGSWWCPVVSSGVLCFPDGLISQCRCSGTDARCI